ncbi:MAG: Bicarbonate transport ATP-binding protein CmpD [Lentisphaerae bacterium ADurb.Bin242]|nr:MAG: Bicarbonate transport ATP-binding protein CmpD [Lentisphaerae bacterium ADurb.Bin242]
MSSPENHAIRLEHVSFAYSVETVLSEIDLAVDENDFVAVIGPSGCGKSTLLRLVSGLILPSSGEIFANGKKVEAPGLDRAVVFQDYSLFPWITCMGNLVLALEQSRPGVSKKHCREIAEEYLAMVGLAGSGGKIPGELSGGMRQRVAIARALALNSPVLLMDEPFGALDAITRARQQDMLLNIWQTSGGRRKTVVFVTHDVDEALILANRVIVLGVRPGHIAVDIPVPLPRPRSRGNSIGSRPFLLLREQLMRELDLAVSTQLNLAESKDGSGI